MALYIFTEYISFRYKFPLDQVNFIVMLFLSLFMALLLRKLLPPGKVGVKTRLVVELILGLYIAQFLYHWEMLHLLFQSTVCYILIQTLDVKIMPLFVLVFALTHMTLCHLHITLSGTSIYKMDYIGPLMMMTEKVSSLAFSIRDGKFNNKLKPYQKEMATSKIPSLLEFYSYMFYFHGLVLGPLSFYNQFQEFMDGSNLKNKQVSTSVNQNLVVHNKEPSPLRAIIGKLSFSMLMLIGILYLIPKYPLLYNIDEQFVTEPLWYRIGYLCLTIEVAKCKYFFAWTFADAINNAAGLGFNGYDKKGNSKWDLITNIDIYRFETATSFKMLVESWNMPTNIWLRHVCYDRAPPQWKTFLTYLMSSIWHGVYPGYFFTFLTGALVTIAAHKARINFRHHIVTSPTRQVYYDVFTWACTYLALSYLILPFTILDASKSLEFFRSYYYILHIMCIFAIIFLPSTRKNHRKDTQKTENGYQQHINLVAHKHLTVTHNSHNGTTGNGSGQ